MFRFDLKLEEKQEDKNIYDVFTTKNKPVLLTDMLDNIKIINDVLITNKVLTLKDLINTINDIEPRYTDDLDKVRVVNLIVCIMNNPEESTDYSYLIDMFKVGIDSYNVIAEYGSGPTTTTILPFEKPLDPNTPILDVIVTLFNVIGYKHMVLVMNLAMQYSVELD